MKEIPQYKFALRADLKDSKEFLPTRAENKASGWDVRAAQTDKKPIILKPFEHTKIQLGFRSFCPDGWWFELKPRSSTFAKKFLHSLYGTIDEGFEGELVLAVQYIPNLKSAKIFSDEYIEKEEIKYEPKYAMFEKPILTINFGDAIGQIIPVKRQEMIIEEVSNEEYDRLCKERNGQRGAGGFGSTDRK